MATTLRISALGVVLLLAACATTPPATTTPSGTASANPSVGSAPASTPAGAQPTADPSGTASGSASPSATGIELGGKGITGSPFGTDEDDVEAVLTAHAGKADESYSGPVCELDSATPYGRQLAYGAAVFLFESKPRGKDSSPRTFTSWVVNIGEPLAVALRLTAGYPADPTFAQLKRTFPDGKLQRIALGESAVYVFRTPSGIWYRGDDNKTPTDIGAGAMGTCE